MSANTKFFPEFSNPKTYLRNYNRGCEILGVDLPYLTKEKVKEVFIAGKPLNELEAAYDNLEASIRKSSQDKERNEIALSLMKKIANEVIYKRNYVEIIPPRFWHRCNRINLYFTRCVSEWKRITENISVGLIRQAGESAWRVQVKILENGEWRIYTSPTYVYKLGLNVPEFEAGIVLNQNDNTVWGIEYQFGKYDWYSGEFCLRNKVFSFFRHNNHWENMYHYPNRQGDVYYVPDNWEDYKRDNNKLIAKKYDRNVEFVRATESILPRFHSHLVSIINQGVVYVNGSDVIILAYSPVTITHKDHRTIVLQHGVYRVLEIPGHTDPITRVPFVLEVIR